MSLEFFSLAIASVSLLVAGLSLGWQILAWLLSAGRPRLVLLHGMVGDRGVMTGPVERGGAPRDIARIRDQGFDGEEIIGVQVTNRGRASLTVESVAVRMKGSPTSYVPVDQLIGETLPYQLAAGTNSSWFTPMGICRELAATLQSTVGEHVKGVYIVVTFATGKSRRTPTTLRL